MPVSDLLIFGELGIKHPSFNASVATSVTDSEQTSKGFAVTATTVPTKAWLTAKSLFIRAWRLFNNSDSDSIVTNLSAETKLTFAFWLWQDAFINNDRLLFEFNTNGAGGNQINPNSAGTGAFALMMDGGGGRYDTFPRPSAAAWHHYVMIQERVGPSNTVYVDGTLQGLTNISSGAVAANWANSTLWIMSRGGTSLFNAGRVGQLGIWGSAVTLTAGQRQQLVNGQNPSTVQSSGLLQERYTIPPVVVTLTAGTVFGKILTATVTVLATLLKQAGAARAATVGAVASAFKAVGKVRSATVGETAIRLSGVGKALASTVTGSASDQEAVGKGVSATVTPVASFKRRVSKAYSAVVTVLADLVAARPGVMYSIDLSATVSVLASWRRSLVATPVVCAVLTATAKTCDVLGLSSLADSLIALTVASDGTLTLATTSGGYGSGGYGSYPYGAGTPETELVATPAIDN